MRATATHWPINRWWHRSAPPLRLRCCALCARTRDSPRLMGVLNEEKRRTNKARGKKRIHLFCGGVKIGTLARNAWLVHLSVENNGRVCVSACACAQVFTRREGEGGRGIACKRSVTNVAVDLDLNNYPPFRPLLCLTGKKATITENANENGDQPSFFNNRVIFALLKSK